MPAPISLPNFWLAFTPPAAEHWVILIVLVLTVVAAWMLQQKKLQALRQAQSLAADAHASAMAQAEARARSAAADAAEKLAAAEAAHRLLEERFETLRETSRRREAEADLRCAQLTTDLAATREIAAQLAPTQAALEAERGRVSALEQTASVSNKRADDFENRLALAHQDLAGLRQAAELRERELQGRVDELERTQRDNEELVASADRRISEAEDALNSHRQQAETRISNLQRQLAAAEAKAAMVQKEFMSAVGVLPETPATPRHISAGQPDDRRVAELEARLVQMEAESRKKAREDGYKIAELEYRLSEAREALAQKPE